MNRELRRLQEKEEKRQKDQRAKGVVQRPRRERASVLQFIREVRQELRRRGLAQPPGACHVHRSYGHHDHGLAGIIFVMDFFFKKGVLIALGRF